MDKFQIALPQTAPNIMSGALKQRINSAPVVKSDKDFFKCLVGAVEDAGQSYPVAQATTRSLHEALVTYVGILRSADGLEKHVVLGEYAASLLRNVHVSLMWETKKGFRFDRVVGYMDTVLTEMTELKEEAKLDALLDALLAA